MRPAASPILLIDGVCNLCSAAVRFVADRERSPRLRFASLQSEFGRGVLRDHGLAENALDSLVLLDHEGVHQRSEAALRIARDLRAPWSWAAVLRVLPHGLRDALYDFVARNRYRWFGRQDRCLLPRADLASRFVDDTAANEVSA